MTAVIAVTVKCPACRNRTTSQARTYEFRRGYLCDQHGALWDVADDREHAKGRRCPHDPAPCVRFTEDECKNRRAIAATGGAK